MLRVHAHEINFIAWSMGNAGYLCNYLGKEAQKMIPAGFANFGRFWGNSQSLKPQVQDYITSDEMILFSPDNETSWEYLCRNHHEHINLRSTVRKTPQRRTILTGASIAIRLRNHLFKPPAPRPPQKGGATLQLLPQMREACTPQENLRLLSTTREWPVRSHSAGSPE